MSITMHPRNAISAKLAEIYITIDGNRYNFMSAINIEVTFEKTKIEVPILGRNNKGNKAVGSKITGSAEFHYNTSVLRELAYKYQENKEDTYFEMQITNEDPTAEDVGAQTIILYDCNFDNLLLVAFDADSDEILTETMDFTAERFEIPQSFTLMEGVL